MEARFKKGDSAIIYNHPNSEMIGKVVRIDVVGEARFKEGVGFTDQAVYRVSIDGKNLGWAPEVDLCRSFQFKDTPFKESNEIIERFMIKNKFDPMHLEFYLEEKHGVEFAREEFESSYPNAYAED